LAKAAEAVEAAIAGEAKLDAHTLRADFPIFQQRVHGKPLAYLDSAVSAQKPRQVLDALRDFYETSYTNVHRGVYLLAERATERFEGSREKVRAFINAASTREDRRHVAIRAGDHGCQPLMTRLGVAATNPRRLRPLHGPRGDRPPHPGPAHGQHDPRNGASPRRSQ
jgi:hypothetical protein